ncbi:hypothetical protein HDV00_000703 [Rhizophlyctis rosea]|nr:hypothetical protein HDV00_000703 [Rhizophlyctis rosea]
MLERRRQFHAYLENLSEPVIKRICSKLDIPTEDTNTSLILRIEEQLEKQLPTPNTGLQLWMIPSPSDLPDLPPELVHKIARMSGPIVSRNFRRMDKYYRKFITDKDVQWAEAGYRYRTE